MRLKVNLNIAYVLFISVLLSACGAGYYPVKSTRNLYPIDVKIAQDSSILAFYQPYKSKLDAEMNKVIGVSTHALVKKSAVAESTLGNFFADACLQQAMLIDKNIDFAMPSTTGGLRADLPSGDLKLLNIFEVMPFENELVVIEMKGKDVQELVNFIVASGGQPIAGIEIKYSDKVATDIKIKGVPFDISRNYKVLTSDYIIGGGDNVKGLQNIVNKSVVGLKVRDALLAYVQQETAAGRKINTNLDGRIKQN